MIVYTGSIRVSTTLAIRGLGAFSLATVRASFVLPLISFVVIALYGRRAAEVHAEPAA